MFNHQENIAMITAIILIGFIPLSGLIFFFVKDKHLKRQRLLRILFLANLLLFVSPLLYAFATSFPDGNIWSDNGAGAVMWSYVLIGPFCFIAQVTLLVLKFTLPQPKSDVQMIHGQ